MTKLQRKILCFLLVLCVLTPIGILLPMVFDAGDAWGEWSATTLSDLIGYVPSGLEKYSNIWNAPIPDYSLNEADPSVVHQSGYYIVSGVVGATLTYLVTLLISKIIVKNGD
ncbi:MAG: hypothetical protein Q8O72_04765 [Bacteroidales bacterium]|nr:hypothetical protein [Bacteroidales bacterium]